jgi:hypothetical protein
MRLQFKKEDGTISTTDSISPRLVATLVSLAAVVHWDYSGSPWISKAAETLSHSTPHQQNPLPAGLKEHYNRHNHQLLAGQNPG